MTSCFSCVDICECVWCFCMSTAANASARLRIPSFRPENMSPWKYEETYDEEEFRQVSVILIKVFECVGGRGEIDCGKYKNNII